MTDSAAASNAPVGIIDSGIGGLPYLERCRQLMPNESFVYLADRANFPFGSRERSEIRRIVLDAVGLLVESARPKLVVVACNTASVVSLDELRSRFEIPFVGVVPAIKPAAAMAPGGRIGILATEHTVRDPYLNMLKQRFAADNALITIPAPGLVEIIEKEFPFAEDEASIHESSSRLLDKHVQVVVLGCTHFVHIRQSLEKQLGHTVPVVDSVDGVARQTIRKNPALREVPGQRDVFLYTGSELPPENYVRLAHRYGLTLKALSPPR